MLTCPACGVTASDGSAFCEDCGSALSAAAAAAAAPVDPALRCPSCGAGPGEVDADGFCSQCGTRRLRAPRDRVEDVLSPRAAGVSDIGCRYDENQDYFVLAAGDRGEIVAVVCDGVSRSQNAMLGSKLACEGALAAIRADLATPQTLDDPNAVLVRAMAAAQEAICTVPFVRGLTVDDTEPLPPAQATAVGVLVIGRRITVGWLGDSRAYWLGRGAARQLTIDHSWLDEVVASGEMTEEQAHADPRARAIVRSLGADLDGGNPGVVPDAVTLNVTEGGVLLVVSDGFYAYADERQIAQLVRGFGPDVDAMTMARRLVDHARDGGGADNITVVAIQF